MIVNHDDLFNYIREKGKVGNYNNQPSKFLQLGDKKLHAVYEDEIYIIGEQDNIIEDKQQTKVLYMED